MSSVHKLPLTSGYIKLRWLWGCWLAWELLNRIEETVYVLSLRCLRNSKRDLRGWMFRSDNWCLGKNLKLLGVDLVSSFLDQHSKRQNGDKRNLKPTANMWYSGLSAARDQYRTPCPKLLCISQRRRGRILFRPTLSVWCPSKRKVKHFGVERSTWFNIYKNHWSHCITGLVSCTPLYPQVSTGCIALPRSLRGARARLSQRIFVPGHFFQMPQETKPLAAENMLLNKWFCCMQRHDVARNDVMSPNWWFLHVFTLKMNLYFATASLISAFINQNPCFDL